MPKLKRPFQPRSHLPCSSLPRSILLLLAPLLLHAAAARPLGPYTTPTAVFLGTDGATYVRLCFLVNVTLPPHMFPFYDDLVRNSGCDTNHYEVELDELVTQLSEETPPEHWHTPSGFLIHAMRAGSTAAANMVGASPDAIVFKEPQAMTDALMLANPIHDSVNPKPSEPPKGERAQREQEQRRQSTRRQSQLCLRAIVQLFFRASASQRLYIFQGQSNARDRAAATALVFKLSSAGTASEGSLSVLRSSFPLVPFAYLVRDPAASVASLLVADTPVRVGRTCPTREHPSCAVKIARQPCYSFWRLIPGAMALADGTRALECMMAPAC